MQFSAARTAHICISERQNNLFNTKGQKHEGWLNPLMWFWKWYKNDLHTNVHLSVLGFRVSSPFVLTSLRPEEAVCSIYVRPRCEGDAENVPWACSAEQSDMTGCQRPNKPWPKYQRVWHETGSRGHDVCVCVCEGPVDLDTLGLAFFLFPAEDVPMNQKSQMEWKNEFGDFFWMGAVSWCT